MRITKPPKCMMSINGYCNSDYGKGIRCNGISKSPRCPYSKENFEEAKT